MIAATVVEDHLELLEHPDPVPGPGEVLVEVRSSGINAAARLQVAGHYPAPPGVPANIPGLELAGVAISRGESVEGDWVGLRVATIVGGGAHATRCVVPVEHLLRVPDAVSDLDAGGFAEAAVTAHDALVSQAALSSGERVVISGASGGVGHLAVQIAARRGAHVIAVTRHHDHAARLYDLGASEVRDLDGLDDLAPVDVVLELVGAAHLERILPRVGVGGRIVVIGVGAGRLAQVDLRQIMSTRLQLTGSTLRWRSRVEKALALEGVRRDLMTDWAQGALRVELSDTFHLSDAPRAYEEFSHPGKFGKIVLRMNQ